MWTALGYIGLLVVLGYLIRTCAQAIRDSGIKRVHLVAEFHNEKPPTQIEK